MLIHASLSCFGASGRRIYRTFSGVLHVRPRPYPVASDARWAYSCFGWMLICLLLASKYCSNAVYLSHSGDRSCRECLGLSINRILPVFKALS